MITLENIAENRWMMLAGAAAIPFAAFSTYYYFYSNKPKPNASRRFTSSNILPNYDFIIVGSGSAGSVVASRLVESGFSVLLLEFGGEYHQDPRLTQPSGWTNLFHSDVDYGFATTPQPYLGNRRMIVNRGRTTGGCSAVNAAMWVRGCREDYDRWGKEMGNEGWSYDEVLPAFKSLENYPNGDERYRGREGPIFVTQVGRRSTDITRWFKALEKSGFSYVEDYNAENKEGMSYTQENHTNLQRNDAFSCFVEPVLANEKTSSSIKVISEAVVTRVLFDTTNTNSSNVRPKAIGVEFQADGKTHIVHCRREVILSAGAINSPQLLMLSGIGPKQDLERFHIPVIVNNPYVGQNYLDHILYPYATVLKSPVSFGEGGGSSAMLFFQSSWSKEHTPHYGPDIQVTFASGPLLERSLAYDVAKSIVGFAERKDSVLEKLFPAIFSLLRVVFSLPGLSSIPKRMVNNALIVNQPVSRGELRLQSTDPRVQPRIDPRTGSAPEDIDRLVEVLKWMRIVWKNPELNDRASFELKPSIFVQSDKALRKSVERNIMYAWHPVGTCKMGIGNDSVVDPRLKVRGVDNLRVIDASIMPTIVSGNTNSPTMMIAARAVEFILKQYKNE